MNAQQKKAMESHKKRITAAVVETGHYLPSDDLLIEHAALTLTLIDQARKDVKHIQVFPTVATQIAPEMNNLRGLLKDFIGYTKELGLSPAARKALKIEPQKEEEAPSPIMALRMKMAQ